MLEPPYKGHFGTSCFIPCREDVPFLEVKNVLMLWERDPEHCYSVLFWEVVPFWEGPLLEVPLYVTTTCPFFQTITAITRKHDTSQRGHLYKGQS